MIHAAPSFLRSQAHFSACSDVNSPLSILVMYFPIVGRNFQLWNEPPPAMYNPLHAG
jgi:hypothetical protein